MNNNESIGERRAREAAERIAAHQRATARPRVPQHDDHFEDSLPLHRRRQQEDAGVVAKAERAKYRAFYEKRGMPVPPEYREPNGAA